MTADPDPSTIPPHLAARIAKIKARAVEVGMDPARFDDLLTATAESTRRAFRPDEPETTGRRKLYVAPTPTQEPLRATKPNPDARQVATTLLTVCVVFVCGAAVGRWLTRS